MMSKRLPPTGRPFLTAVLYMAVRLCVKPQTEGQRLYDSGVSMNAVTCAASQISICCKV